jgi:hypothetical protein
VAPARIGSFGQTGGSRRLSEFNATSFLDPLTRYFYPLSMPHTQITTSTLTGVPKEVAMDRYIASAISMILLCTLAAAVHTNAQTGTPTSSDADRPKTQASEPAIVFDHIAIGVRDIDTIAEWYVKYLGFKRSGGYELPKDGHALPSSAWERYG